MVRHDDIVTNLTTIHAGVSQGSVLGPILYLIYTGDLPQTEGMTMGTFADDTAILAEHDDPEQAIKLLQNIKNIEDWTKHWRIKVNETNSIYVTFTTKRKTYPPVKLNDIDIPQYDEVKYWVKH